MERSIVPMMGRDMNGVQKAAGPATQLSVVLDGNRVWGSEFGDAGLAADNPAEHVDLLGVGQAVGDGVGDDLKQV